MLFCSTRLWAVVLGKPQLCAVLGWLLPLQERKLCVFHSSLPPSFLWCFKGKSAGTVMGWGSQWHVYHNCPSNSKEKMCVNSSEHVGVPSVTVAYEKVHTGDFFCFYESMRITSSCITKCFVNMEKSLAWYNSHQYIFFQCTKIYCFTIPKLSQRVFIRIIWWSHRKCFVQCWFNILVSDGTVLAKGDCYQTSHQAKTIIFHSCAPIIPY